MMIGVQNNLDYIGVGVGLTAMSILLENASYVLCSLRFGIILPWSTADTIAGTTLFLSSLALGAATSAIGLVTGDLPFKEFAGLSIASGVMAYALGWMSTQWSTLVKDTDRSGERLHRD